MQYPHQQQFYHPVQHPSYYPAPMMPVYGTPSSAPVFSHHMPVNTPLTAAAPLMTSVPGPSPFSFRQSAYVQAGSVPVNPLSSDQGSVGVHQLQQFDQRLASAEPNAASDPRIRASPHAMSSGIARSGRKSNRVTIYDLDPAEPNLKGVVGLQRSIELREQERARRREIDRAHAASVAKQTAKEEENVRNNLKSTAWIAGSERTEANENPPTTVTSTGFALTPGRRPSGIEKRFNK